MLFKVEVLIKEFVKVMVFVREVCFIYYLNKFRGFISCKIKMIMIWGDFICFFVFILLCVYLLSFYWFLVFLCDWFCIVRFYFLVMWFRRINWNVWFLYIGVCLFVFYRRWFVILSSVFFVFMGIFLRKWRCEIFVLVNFCLLVKGFLCCSVVVC